MAGDLPIRTAAGYVLYRDDPDGQRRYLLLTNAHRGELGFPKGHAEDGESMAETAARETREETGLTDVEVRGDFRRAMIYKVARKKKPYEKRVGYFLARSQSGDVALSSEHSAATWATLPQALDLAPFPMMRELLREAALFGKDRALFDLEPATLAQARAHLRAQPHVTDHLVAHLEGGATLATQFAQALAAAGLPIHVNATSVGTMLHDVGRALGKHDDHQRAGLGHLRGTPLAAYGFACVSHFTKGATPDELRAAGISDGLISDFLQLIDMHDLTSEEKCAALADACMKGSTPVHPDERFADLRARYDAEDLIALQERRTAAIREELRAAIGRDPLELAGLA